MYSVDNLCPSSILSSSKRQLCFHQEPFLKSEHQKCGRLGTGAVPQARPRAGTPFPEQVEGQACPPSRLSMDLTFLVTLLAI